MRYLILVLFPLMVTTQQSYAQDFSYYDVNQCINSVQRTYTTFPKGAVRKKDLYIHPLTLRKVTTSLLSNFTLGYDGTGQNITNGTIKAGGDKTAASISASIFPKSFSGVFFTIGVNGAIEENVLSISSAGKYNGGWSTEGSMFIKLHSSIFYYNKKNCAGEGNELSKTLLTGKRKDYFTNLKIQYSKALKSDNRVYMSAQEKRDQLQVELDQLRQDLENNINIPPMIALLSDSEIDAITAKIKDKQAALESLSTVCDPICNIVLDSLVSFEKRLIKDNPISLGWLKISLQYGKSVYNTIDTSMRYFPAQDGELNYDKKGLSISYNYFRRARKYAWSFSGGIGYLYNNTFADGKPLELKNITTFDSANVRREYSKDIKAYDIKKNPYKEFDAYNAFAQSQFFIGKRKNIGFDIGSMVTVNVKEDITVGVWDAFAGIIYSDNNADDQSTNYSLELLLKASDMTTVVNEERLDFGKKLDLSLKLAIPLSKLIIQP